MTISGSGQSQIIRPFSTSTVQNQKWWVLASVACGTFMATLDSSIVNIARVDALKLNSEGEYEVVLNQGMRLRLSRRYRKQAQLRLGVGDAS